MNTAASHHKPGPFGSGSGTLTIGGVSTSVTTPIIFGDGDYSLLDNENNAVITGGNGNDVVIELGKSPTITLGNGNNVVSARGGNIVVKLGNGDQRVLLSGAGNSVTVGSTNGGTLDATYIHAGDDHATVVAGNGNMIISVNGEHNSVTVGNGNDQIEIGACSMGAITATTVNLGNGTNHLFVRGTGDIINDGSGTDYIRAIDAKSETFVLNAAGGTETIAGFTITNGDVLDLGKILAGTTIAADLSNLSSFATLTTVQDAHRHAWTDTVLKIQGPGGTANVTLINTGTVSLADLTSAHSFSLT